VPLESVAKITLGRRAVTHDAPDVSAVLVRHNARQSHPSPSFGATGVGPAGRRQMRRSVLGPMARRPHVLVQMICARVLARSAYSHRARDRQLCMCHTALGGGPSGCIELALYGPCVGLPTFAGRCQRDKRSIFDLDAIGAENVARGP
jgi:hypothetical protein